MNRTERNFLLVLNCKEIHDALRANLTVALFGSQNLFSDFKGYKNQQLKTASDKLRNRHVNLYIVRIRRGDLEKQREQLSVILHNRDYQIPTICFFDLPFRLATLRKYNNLRSQYLSEFANLFQINTSILNDLSLGINLRLNRKVDNRSKKYNKSNDHEYAQQLIREKNNQNQKTINMTVNNNSLYHSSSGKSAGKENDYKRYIDEPFGSRRDYQRDRASWKRTNS